MTSVSKYYDWNSRMGMHLVLHILQPFDIIKKDWKHENQFYFLFVRVKLCSYVSDINKNAIVKFSILYSKVSYYLVYSLILRALYFFCRLVDIFYYLFNRCTLENDLVWTFNKPIFHNFRSPFFWHLNLRRATAKA